MPTDAKFPSGAEKRFLLDLGAEVRAHADGRGLTGYAAVFNTPGRIGDFTEVVKPGAFSVSLADTQDILALANHDMTHVLGRTGAGTLRLSQDTRGLHFDISALPETGYANDMLALIRSGNIGGCSFCFTPRAGGDIWEGRSRQLTSIKLHEISIIAGVPAYSGTSVHARSQPDGGAAARLRRLAWVTL